MWFVGIVVDYRMSFFSGVYHKEPGEGLGVLVEGGCGI